MIVKNRLLNFQNKIIYQDDDYFAFSLDSLLLANFVTINFKCKKIIDLCTGNAPIPMFLTYRTKANIVGVEVQDEIFDLGNKSIIDNDFQNRIELLKMDIRDLPNHFSSESFDVVTCNPPYFKCDDTSYVNNNLVKTIARHEYLVNLDDVIKECSYLVKNGGYVGLVHRPERFVEIIDLMKKYKITPKKVRFVYPKMGKEANILLIEGVKNGNGGLKVLAPLFVHNEDGSYVSEIREMFGDDGYVAK